MANEINSEWVKTFNWDDISGRDFRIIAVHDEWEDNGGIVHKTDILSAHDLSSGKVYVLAERSIPSADHAKVAEEVIDSCITVRGLGEYQVDIDFEKAAAILAKHYGKKGE